MYEEVKAMKSVCGPDVHMKAILAVGELASMNNVYKASLVCMMAGADFIKTSTGKEAVNAILPVGVVMCRYALCKYHGIQCLKVFHHLESIPKTSLPTLLESWCNRNYDLLKK